jgi:hypothetical protein
MKKTALYWPAALAICVSASVGLLVHPPSLNTAAADPQFLPEDHIVLKSARDVDVKAGTALRVYNG